MQNAQQAWNYDAGYKAQPQMMQQQPQMQQGMAQQQFPMMNYNQPQQQQGAWPVKGKGQAKGQGGFKGFQGKQGGKWDQNPNFQGMQRGMGLPAFSQGMQGAQQFQYQ